MYLPAPSKIADSHHFLRRMCVIALLALVACLVFCADLASAQSWTFRRSYYSHDPTQRVQIGAPTNTRLRYTEPAGQYLRWGWRNSNLSGNIRSNSDNFRVFEAWVQGGSQF